MTEPPITPDVVELDQAVIAAGYELVNAHREVPPNPERITAAREALVAAREARWPNG